MLRVLLIMITSGDASYGYFDAKQVRKLEFLSDGVAICILLWDLASFAKTLK